MWQERRLVEAIVMGATCGANVCAQTTWVVLRQAVATAAVTNSSHSVSSRSVLCEATLVETYLCRPVSLVHTVRIVL